MADACAKNGLAAMASAQPGAGIDSGRRRFLADIYQSYWFEICRYISSTFGAGPPEPEEVAQDAFTRFAALEDPESVDNPRAFLYKTAHNIVINHHRKNTLHNKYVKREVGQLAEDILDDLHPERVLLGKERYRVLKQAFKRLPQRQQRLVVMHRIHGLSYVESARRMQMSQTEVKRQVANAIVECEEALHYAFREKGSKGVGDE